MSIVHVQIPELVVPGKRLGRHVAHDDRSRAFRLFRAEPMPALVSVRWEREAPVFDQGDLGSCTANATLGCFGTGPLARPEAPTWTEDDAVALYTEVTAIDPGPPGYPPADTGSSGIAAMQAAEARGWCSQYEHAFSAEEALAGIVRGPGIFGLMWLEGCDEPDAHGVVQYQGAPRGGHEVCFEGLEVVLNDDGSLNLDRSMVVPCNSWGESWGESGRFRMSVADFTRALDAQGDACFPPPP